MKQALWHRLDIIARSLSPLAMTLLLIMIGMVPLQIPDMAPLILKKGSRKSIIRRKVLSKKSPSFLH